MHSAFQKSSWLWYFVTGKWLQVGDLNKYLFIQLCHLLDVPQFFWQSNWLKGKSKTLEWMYDLSLFCFAYSETGMRWYRNPQPNHESVPYGLSLTIASWISTIFIFFLKNWDELSHFIYVYTYVHTLFFFTKPTQKIWEIMLFLRVILC